MTNYSKDLVRNSSPATQEIETEVASVINKSNTFMRISQVIVFSMCLVIPDSIDSSRYDPSNPLVKHISSLTSLFQGSVRDVISGSFFNDLEAKPLINKKQWEGSTFLKLDTKLSEVEKRKLNLRQINTVYESVISLPDAHHSDEVFGRRLNVWYNIVWPDLTG